MEITVGASDRVPTDFGLAPGDRRKPALDPIRREARRDELKLHSKRTVLASYGGPAYLREGCSLAVRVPPGLNKDL